jgi:RNA polymerase sigma factor (sigma-70 family)
VSTAGSAPIVDKIYRENHSWLHAWLRKKLGCSHNAADLAQDTFIRLMIALAKKGETELNIQEPRAYLTTIASRVLINHHRRQTLEQAYLEALATVPESVSASPEQRALILETLNEIDAVLSALPRKVRTVFLMAQLDGLAYEDIAKELLISIRSVQRYMAMAYEQCFQSQN